MKSLDTGNETANETCCIFRMCGGLAQNPTSVNALLHVAAHVLGELAEELPEQAGQQGAPQVQPLVRVVVPVVLLSPPQRHLPDTSAHDCNPLHANELHMPLL